MKFRSMAVKPGFFCPCCGSVDLAPLNDRIYNTVCTVCGTQFRITHGTTPADYAEDVSGAPYELVNYAKMPVENIGVMARFLYPELRWTASDPELCDWIDDYTRYMDWLNHGNVPGNAELVETYGDLVRDITSFGGSQEIEVLEEEYDPAAVELVERLEALVDRYR